MSGPETCEVCGELSRQRCSGCHSACYCSKEHQRQHWKTHKLTCSSFKVVEVEGLGRCLVAKRDINSGEVVLKERPLVSGPPQVTGPVCLGCHTRLAPPGVPCPECGWPLCSLECKDSPHHKPECEWARTKRKAKVSISNFAEPHPTYACITPLRLLYLKMTNKSLWARISTLAHHTEERRKDGKYEQERFAVAGLLRRFYKLEEEVSEEEVLHVCGIIQINCHDVPLSDPSHISLYWRSSFLEHSCAPNCSKSFTEGGEVLIRASVGVRSGDRLSISYTDPLWSTPARLLHLKETKYFDCACTRCADVTEFGTHFSAVSCKESNCKGNLLPLSFSEPSSDWTCDVCSAAVDLSVISHVLKEVGDKRSLVDKRYHPACLNFLEETKDALPDNHHWRVEVKLALMQLIGQEEAGGMAAVSDEWILTKESLARQLIAVAQKLFVAECRLLGSLYFDLQTAVAEKSRRMAAKGEDGSICGLLLEARDCLEMCINCLKYEPPCLPEGAICKQAYENLNEVDELIERLTCSDTKQ